MPYKFNPFTGTLDLVDTTTAGGADKQIQFNDGGVLNGVANLTFDKTTNFFQTNYTSGDNTFSLIDGQFVLNGIGIILPFSGSILEDSVTTHQAGVGTFDLTAFGLGSVASGIVYSDGAGGFTTILVQDQNIQISTNDSLFSLGTDLTFSSNNIGFDATTSFNIRINTSQVVSIDTTGKMSFLLPSVDFDYAPINLVSTGSDPSNLVEGDLWRNGDSLYFKNSTGNIDLIVGIGEFADDVFRVYNPTDTSKKVGFKTGDIGASTVRFLTVPDRDINLDEITDGVTETTIPNYSLLTAKGDGTITGYSNELEFFNASTINANLRVRVDDIEENLTSNLSLVNGSNISGTRQQYSPALMFQGAQYDGHGEQSNYKYIRAWSNNFLQLLTIVDAGRERFGFNENNFRTLKDVYFYFNNTFGTEADKDMRYTLNSSTGDFEIDFRVSGTYETILSLSNSGLLTLEDGIITVGDAEIGGNITVGKRLLGARGIDVTSANDITLGDGNYFHIRGTTQINTISKKNWTAGSVVILQFNESVTVKHATAGTGAQLQLASASDFSATAGDTLTLVYDGTYWRETARTAI
jgi:hypothetical protein